MEKRTTLTLDTEPGQVVLTEKLGADLLALAAWFARGDEGLQTDLEQEGRLALWRARQTYRPAWKANFRTYARACIRNAMLDYVKREKRWALRWISLQEETVAVELDQQAADRWHGGESFLRQMAGLERREEVENPDLRRVLAVLTDAEWQVLKRTVVDGMSDAEVAAKLDKSVAAVKQLRSRAAQAGS